MNPRGDEDNVFALKHERSAPPREFREQVRIDSRLPLVLKESPTMSDQIKMLGQEPSKTFHDDDLEKEQLLLGKSSASKYADQCSNRSDNRLKMLSHGRVHVGPSSATGRGPSQMGPTNASSASDASSRYCGLLIVLLSSVLGPSNLYAQLSYVAVANQLTAV